MNIKKVVKFAWRENSGLCKEWLSRIFLCFPLQKILVFATWGKKMENEKKISSPCLPYEKKSVFAKALYPECLTLNAVPKNPVFVSFLNNLTTPA